jgi:hypothetical protein
MKNENENGAIPRRGEHFCRGLSIGMVLSFAWAKRGNENQTQWYRACDMVGAQGKARESLVAFEAHCRGLGWSSDALFLALGRRHQFG